MAAQKRTELYLVTPFDGETHDRADSAAAPPPQLQPGASQMAEHELPGPSEPSDPEEGNDCGYGSPPSSESSDGIHPLRALPINIPDEGPAPNSTATTVEEPPRENFDAVAINPNLTLRRRGVYALHNMPADRRTIYETPQFSCDKPRPYRPGRDHRVALAWIRLSRENSASLQEAFFTARGLTKHDRRVNGLTKDQRLQLEAFVRDYAFADVSGSRRHVYRIASHFRHACGKCANAKFSIDSDEPNHISVTLLRPVNEGEELYITYKRFQHPACLVCGSLRRNFKALEKRQQDTLVNPPQQNHPQQPQEIQQHPGEAQQQPPTDHQQQPAEDQQPPQTRGQRFRQRIRRAGRWLLGPDQTFTRRVRLGEVGDWGI
ncbi:hypothetical protein BHE90_011830 [Fusarium euwallaceae]|uniref:SET domain-containing protein n=5 Tax=Fusarium solani species complex TaxID=232080 RepID=A0A3M2SE64_9HYPO|nr:hypothetical protein CDV36_004819 [Fusarium kuroshium]RSL78506.1 hypothetical protein CEP51_008150 [Fusarium floridanum]RSM11363.1 hypothetical protein CDV31_006801 [Fusarium ambrosium]RSM13907.1 hypothetical protein CEP52_001590 [Fusarium oligoseptatum]RTE73730.1 hypothetical protein BHE90_011830 [Fusarium euwallaceae]